jgi:sec-independent protein translocase protein TatA
MGGLSIWHWLIVGAIVLIVFGGKGKVSDVMGDFAKGIKAFKKGMQDDEPVAKAPAEPPRTLEQTPPPPPPPPVHAQDPASDGRKFG